MRARCGTPAFFASLVVAMVVATVLAALAPDWVALAAAVAVVAVTLLVARNRGGCAVPAMDQGVDGREPSRR